MQLPWPQIHTVLLDMDGTLLDLRFDNYFWRQVVPQHYAAQHGLTLQQAQHEVTTRTQAQHGTLHWYCLDYWTQALGLNIALLKREAAHLIAVHPHVLEFLEALRTANRQVLLVTNAHQDSLALKMEKTQLAGYFDTLISAHTIGWAKEQPQFWPCLQRCVAFDPATTLLVDDNLAVLHTAQQYGIAHLLAVAVPDSAGERQQSAPFPTLESFAQLLPLAASPLE